MSDPARPDFPQNGYRFFQQYAFSTGTAGVSPQFSYSRCRCVRQGNSPECRRASKTSLPTHPPFLSTDSPTELKKIRVRKNARQTRSASLPADAHRQPCDRAGAQQIPGPQTQTGGHQTTEVKRQDPIGRRTAAGLTSPSLRRARGWSEGGCRDSAGRSDSECRCNRSGPCGPA